MNMSECATTDTAAVTAARQPIETYARTLAPGYPSHGYFVNVALSTAAELEQGRYDGHPHRVDHVTGAAACLDQEAHFAPRDVAQHMTELARLLRAAA
ncbi:hypothetical protein [Streptomonospora litoralis]|nr:hypothetical protein [Streptomonospora litoralis]